MNPIKWILSTFLLNALISRCNPLYFNNNMDKWMKELLKVSKKEYNSFNEINDLGNRKYCGKSLNHLAGLILDKTDKEGKLIIEGSIISNKLILKLGNIKEKEINIKDIILPVETLSNKCIHIRQSKNNDDSVILCLASKVLRNFWTNSITDAVLCKLTKTRGKLPEYNYALGMDEKREEQNEESDKSGEADEASDSVIDKTSVQKNEQNLVRKKIIGEEFDEEQENEPKGLKLRIAKSKFGNPHIKINGKNVEEIKNDRSVKGTNKLENQKKDESIESVEDDDEQDVEDE
ncbi:hypothetical protein, conserved [Plasmodium gonderi]|uniref:PH domain-containing protein n=1 Tax=Plasmodium gonderi TaxID=77519 RepID=A0A1Y1JC85_PLAGO|nr:hypothetical protein, conserved [Plasmodium gonderi]GAW80106.1 hypothetical protein, conserved [Plasmodium gonderi]